MTLLFVVCDMFLVVDSLSIEAAFQMVSHFRPRVDLTARASSRLSAYFVCSERSTWLQGASV